jgi:hypothetical protein
MQVLTPTTTYTTTASAVSALADAARVADAASSASSACTACVIVAERLAHADADGALAYARVAARGVRLAADRRAYDPLRLTTDTTAAAVALARSVAAHLSVKALASGHPAPRSAYRAASVAAVATGHLLGGDPHAVQALEAARSAVSDLVSAVLALADATPQEALP